MLPLGNPPTGLRKALETGVAAKAYYDSRLQEEAQWEWHHWHEDIFIQKSNLKTAAPLRNWGRLLLEFVGVLRTRKVYSVTLRVCQTPRAQRRDLFIK